jgi:hypothetical protein
VTGDRKKRIPSRFLYEFLRTAVSLFAASVRFLNARNSNKTAVSTQLLVTCHLSPVTFKEINLRIYFPGRQESTASIGFDPCYPCPSVADFIFVNQSSGA